MAASYLPGNRATVDDGVSNQLVHEIYEGEGKGSVLAVTHIFHGETRKRAREIKKAHMETDRFLRAAETDREFEGIPLRVKEHWTGE